jgi:PKD repeat protein
LGDGTTNSEADPLPPYPYSGYASTGIYTITLNVTNIDSTSSVSKQIQAIPSPSTEFTITRSDNTVTVEASESNATNWEWDFGDGSTASGRIATHTYTSTETLEQAVISLRVTANNGCVGSAFQYLLGDNEIYLPLIIKEN